MDGFTSEERARIDGFYKNGFADMSADDVALYSRWLQKKTEIETRQNMEKEAQIELMNAQAAQAREGAKLAQAQFEKLALEMRDKWGKAVNDGEEK